MWKWHNKRQSACETLGQITFFRVSRVPKQWTGIFKVSNTCTNLCNNMVEEKAGVEKQNSKKGFEKNEHACIVEGVLGFRIFLPVLYLKVAGPTRKIQSSSKLRQFQRWQAEFPDSQLGLTGRGNANVLVLIYVPEVGHFYLVCPCKSTCLCPCQATYISK